jgi:hypothetical protein
MAIASGTAELIAGGASLLGSSMDRRAQGKQANKANEAAMANTQGQLNTLLPAYQQAQEAMMGGYGQAGDIRQQALNQGTQLLGSSFMPQMEAMQGGNFAAQQALMQSLPMMRAAILGGKMPSAPQAQMMPVNASALSGLINPQAQQFPAMQQFAPLQQAKSLR